MKTLSLLTLLTVGASASAQMGPPPGGPGGPGGPPPSTANRASGGASARTGSTFAGTETIWLLTLATVQKDLGLTRDEYDALGTTAKSLKTGATEDTALAAVAKVLTADQTTRLKELLVQDLGYNALALADVRAALSLTADQQTAITALVSSLQTSTQAVVATPDAAATRARLRSQTSANLAKLLTAEQDAKLRNLAGRALGAG